MGSLGSVVVVAAADGDEEDLFEAEVSAGCCVEEGGLMSNDAADGGPRGC